MAKTDTADHQDKHEFGRLVAETWRSSGLGVNEFCRNEGLCTSSFYRWRAILESPEAAAKDGERKRADISHEVASQNIPAFISLKSKPSAGNDSHVPCFLGVEIILAERCTLRVGPGFDADTLEKVLAVMEALVC